MELNKLKRDYGHLFVFDDDLVSRGCNSRFFEFDYHFKNKSLYDHEYEFEFILMIVSEFE